MAHTKLHSLGSLTDHSSCTLAELNALISDFDFGDSAISYQTAGAAVNTAFADLGNGYSVTVPSTGKYLVQAFINIQIIPTAASTNYDCRFRFHDGSSQVGSSSSHNLYNQGGYATVVQGRVSSCVHFSDIVDLTVSDDITVQGRASHGTQITTYYHNPLNIGALLLIRIGEWILTRDWMPGL